MRQADVKKHIAAGTPLALAGSLREEPSNVAGRFTYGGGRWEGLESQTRVVALSLERGSVRVKTGSTAMRSYYADRDMPVVKVRADDGREGYVTPRSLSGTWDEWEAFRAAWDARIERENESAEAKTRRAAAAADVLGGSAHASGSVMLSIEQAERLAVLLSPSPSGSEQEAA